MGEPVFEDPVWAGLQLRHCGAPLGVAPAQVIEHPVGPYLVVGGVAVKLPEGLIGFVADIPLGCQSGSCDVPYAIVCM